MGGRFGGRERRRAPAAPAAASRVPAPAAAAPPAPAPSQQAGSEARQSAGRGLTAAIVRALHRLLHAPQRLGPRQAAAHAAAGHWLAAAAAAQLCSVGRGARRCRRLVRGGLRAAVCRLRRGVRARRLCRRRHLCHLNVAGRHAQVRGSCAGVELRQRGALRRPLFHCKQRLFKQALHLVTRHVLRRRRAARRKQVRWRRAQPAGLTTPASPACSLPGLQRPAQPQALAAAPAPGSPRRSRAPSRRRRPPWLARVIRGTRSRRGTICPGPGPPRLWWGCTEGAWVLESIKVLVPGGGRRCPGPGPPWLHGSEEKRVGVSRQAECQETTLVVGDVQGLHVCGWTILCGSAAVRSATVGASRRVAAAAGLRPAPAERWCPAQQPPRPRWAAPVPCCACPARQRQRAHAPTGTRMSLSLCSSRKKGVIRPSTQAAITAGGQRNARRQWDGRSGGSFAARQTSAPAAVAPVATAPKLTQNVNHVSGQQVARAPHDEPVGALRRRRGCRAGQYGGGRSAGARRVHKGSTAVPGAALAPGLHLIQIHSLHSKHGPAPPPAHLAAIDGVRAVPVCHHVWRGKGGAGQHAPHRAARVHGDGVQGIVNLRWVGGWVGGRTGGRVPGCGPATGGSAARGCRGADDLWRVGGRVDGQVGSAAGRSAARGAGVRRVIDLKQTMGGPA